MKAQSKMPYSGTRLASYVAKRIQQLRPIKSQAAIAAQAGFANANMLAMIKSGKNRLPLDRVVALARSLECDPRYLFRMAIEQSADEDTRGAIREIFGTIVTENEIGWLEEIRRASNGLDPQISIVARKTLRAILEQD
jgi:transcriptional regulator with XRE-family HTH domain